MRGRPNVSKMNNNSVDLKAGQYVRSVSGESEGMCEYETLKHKQEALSVSQPESAAYPPVLSPLRCAGSVNKTKTIIKHF